MKELSLSGHTHSNYALKNHTHSGYASSSHTHSASQITSGTLSVSRGGTGVTSLSALASAIQPYLPTPGSGSLVDGELTLGNTVKFDDMYWIVCHLDYTERVAYLASTVIASTTTFDDYSSLYSGSTLRTVVKAFEDDMSEGAKTRMVNTTVNSVTAKVFVASYEQMNGSFSYFNSDERRICQDQDYWTSSSYSSGLVYWINDYGEFQYQNGPNRVRGFRPFCAITLS